MTLFDGQLHLLRPEWLWLLLPALIVCALLSARTLARHDWQRDIDPDLLPHLLVGNSSVRKRWPLLITALVAAVLVTVAAAGPSWTKIDVPVMKPADAVVILLDASPSMLAEDVAPSRMQRARFKLADLLRERREGQTGLVVYGGDAFIVAPLTDDNKTLLNLLPQLGPELMPVAGSNPKAGLELALQLLDSSNQSGGRILWITDGVTEPQVQGLIDALGAKRRSITILGVGTDRGAPIPADEGGFLKTEDGEIIVAALDDRLLRRIAKSSGGRYARLELGNDDLAALLEPADTGDSVNVARDFDQWDDRGWLFVFALLPLCLAGFRRGWLLTALLFISVAPEPAYAMEWDSLWQSRDQQAAAAMEKGAHAKAAELFENKEWRAAAQYRAGDFEAAAKTLEGLDSARSHFNRGNALAQQRDLPAAIAAYDAALKIDPDNEDAQFNKALLEEFLKQQPPQDQNQPSDQNDEQNKDGEQKDKQEQSQSDQKQPGENQQQQSSDAQSQDAESDKGEPEDSQQPPEQSESEQQQAEREQQQREAEEQYQQAAAEAQQQEGEPGEQQALLQAEEDESLTEEEQALEQWLRQVPDNPGGLLKRKFRHQHLQRREQGSDPDRRDIAPY